MKELFSEYDLEEFKLRAEQQMIHVDLLNKAFDLVKAFIKDHNLIVYGGLAVHYALMSANEKLYAEHTLPDYDVISDDNVNLAYKMGKILHNKGFPQVSVIRAMHVQTMRVRIQTITVMDLSYMPSILYSKVPTLSIETLRYVHPHYQQIDLHSVFCYPYNNAPMEDVYWRWNKVEARLNKLLELWPVSNTADHIAPLDVGIDVAVDHVPHGFYALWLLHDAYKTYQKEFKLAPPKLQISNPIVPEGYSYVDVVIDNHDPAMKEYFRGKSVKYYKPLGGLRKRTIIDNNVRYWFLDGSMLAVSKHNDKLVPNVHFVLMFLLDIAFEDVKYYKTCMAMYEDLIMMSKLVNKAFLKQPQTKERDAAILACPFCVNLNTFGTLSYNETFLVSLENFIRHTNPENDLGSHLPKSLFFSMKKDKLPVYDYKSPYFNDGSEFTT